MRKQRLPCALPSLWSPADRLSCCAILLRRKVQGAHPYAPARSNASSPWPDGGSANILFVPLWANLAQSSARLALRVLRARHRHQALFALRKPVESAEFRSPVRARSAASSARPLGGVKSGRRTGAAGQGWPVCTAPSRARNEGTRLKPNGHPFGFSQARNPRGDFLWVLFLFVQGKYLVVGARKPRLI